MLKHTSVDGICNILWEVNPDWRPIFALYRGHKDFDSSNEFTLYQYTEQLSQWTIVYYLITSSGKLSGDITHAIKSGDTTKDDYFVCDKSSRVFAYQRKHMELIEAIRAGSSEDPGNIPRKRYNLVIKVGTTPVVIDTKLAKWRNKKPGKPKGRGIREFLDPADCKERLKPVKRFLGSDVGYMVIVPKDVYDAHDGSPQFKAFREAGGVICPWYASRLEYLADVRKNVSEQGLRIK